MSASRFSAISRSEFMIAPVPAGISRPTMTFSFRPSSVSCLPLTAASVSTRVVSWNEAAQNRMTLGGLLALLLHPRVEFVELDLVHLLARDQVGLARIGDLDLLQHL